MALFDYQYGVIETVSSRHNFDMEIGKAEIKLKLGELWVIGKQHCFKLDQIKKITLHQALNGKKQEIVILNNTNLR